MNSPLTGSLIKTGTTFQDIHVDMKRRCRSLTTRTCKGVHECGQGAVEHLEERVSAGILLGATQHRVLQDVRDPRAVQGGRSELDTERKTCSDEDSGAEISWRRRDAAGM